MCSFGSTPVSCHNTPDTSTASDLASAASRKSSRERRASTGESGSVTAILNRLNDTGVPISDNRGSTTITKDRIDVARHWKATHPFDPATAFVWE